MNKLSLLFGLWTLVIIVSGCAPPDGDAAAVVNDTAKPANDRAIADNSAAAPLHQLFDDEWQDRLQRYPLFATNMGVHDYNDRLEDASAQAQEGNLTKDKQFLTRLQGIDRDALSTDEQLNYDIFEFIISHRVKLGEYRPYRIPILSDDGFHMAVKQMHEAMPFRTVVDYQNYLARLRAIGPNFRQHIDNMRTGLADGFTQPHAILEGIVPSISGTLVDDPEKSSFFRPFRSFPAYFSDAEAQQLADAGRDVIADTVMSAYAEFLDFFETEYIPGARTGIGISEVVDGKAYYEDLTRFFTTLDDATPDKVHELGLQEVARIREEMEAIITSVEFPGTFSEFIDFLRTDPQFYVTNSEQLLKEAAWIAKQVDGQMPGFFRTLPRMPYGIRPVPDDIAPNYTTGRYWDSAIGGKLGGFYMVNTYALNKRPLYTLAALTAHEGVPGHHHQVSLSKEIDNLPMFRRAFYPHAFGEGWGLYAEKLGIEMGIYQTPYDDFGRLSYEMWRAVRLVVDTGMHYKGWSRQQAQDFLAENSALSLHNVRTEIDRYISWPGQALAYKMGELKILELRQRAEQQLGEKFDIRDFHDAILITGGLPLSLLDKEIMSFIDSQADD
ncbi:MAG: DUF885 domain-containing protein [Gammaproteobacteria bacterium]|nr:DUF885 domain-containing protein [Gammaproteobacteria bacterium]MCY4358864.1 DUF885 domain-containing protein [Gammaproteobacteria bacterium]